MVARQSMVVTDTMGAMMKKLEVPADSACKLTDDQTKFVKEAFMLMDSEGNGEAKFKDMANFMKSMGREATDVQLTDMLTSINAQAGAHGKPKESTTSSAPSTPNPSTHKAIPSPTPSPGR